MNIDKICTLFMNRMRIEGDDGGEREIINNYIEAGADYLKGVACGAEVDFENDTRARELLYNYVFYSRNECLAEFQKNYAAMLRTFRYVYRVKVRRKNEDETEKESD